MSLPWAALLRSGTMADALAGAAHDWPGIWRSQPPQIDEHPPGEHLVWAVFGYPFNRPVLARSNVGVGREPGRADQAYAAFVNVELLADGFYGQKASNYCWFKDLLWCGPLKMPPPPSSSTPEHNTNRPPNSTSSS